MHESNISGLLIIDIMQVAINNEVMIAISDMNYAMPNGMLTTWIESVKLAGVENAMVVALDAHTKARAEALGLAAFEMHLTVSRTSQPLLHFNVWVLHCMHAVAWHAYNLAPGYIGFESNDTVNEMINPCNRVQFWQLDKQHDPQDRRFLKLYGCM